MNHSIKNLSENDSIIIQCETGMYITVFISRLLFARSVQKAELKRKQPKETLPLLLPPHSLSSVRRTSGQQHQASTKNRRNTLHFPFQ